MKKFITSIIVSFLLIYPFTAFAEQSALPEINAKSAILIDANTNTILYEKDATKDYYPASLTKIATAIYAIENGNLNEIVTVSKNARHAKGTRVYLEEGEKVTLLKLIQGLLINSGNDAGIAVAEHMSGSEEAFAIQLTNYVHEKMNATQTTFKNSTGLFHEEHKTTAKDLAFITQYAMQNELFMELFGTVNLRWIGESWDTNVVSHHRMLNGELPYVGITGGKTGYVPESGFTLATSAMRENLNLIAIVLDSGRYDVYRDTRKILDYGFNNFEVQTIKENTNYTFNDMKFTNEAPISYVVKKGNYAHTSVSPTGILHIINNDGAVIKSEPLTNITSVASIPSKEPAKSSIEPTISLKDSSNIENIALLVILTLMSIFFISRIK